MVAAWPHRHEPGPQRGTGVSPRVAVVHERFTDWAGSERVVQQLLQLWPDADVYAPIIDRAVLPPEVAGRRLHDSVLRRLYRGGEHYAHLLPLLPVAMRSFDLTGYDLVVTSHHAFANRVRPPAGTPVLSYTHSPARWMWERSMLDGEGGRLGEAGLSAFARTQRRADRAAAGRLAAVVANSSAVADRVQRWWHRPATVVHPPVDITTYNPDPSMVREDFFLLAGRLVPYKRPEVAAAAAVRAGVRLVVAGDGRSRAAVAAAADTAIGPGSVEQLGRVSDATLRDLYRRCRALVMPGEEDFGIVPVEAQACGAPVVALGVGGALDSVLDGVTGRLYSPGPDPIAALAEALSGFDSGDYDPATVRRHAETFSPEHFRALFGAVAGTLLS